MLNRYKIQIYSALVFIFSSFIAFANEFDKQRPAGVDDKQWSSLKSAVQEAKLLPTPEGVGGNQAHWGHSVSMDGNKAAVGGYKMAGSGAVVILHYNNISWEEETLILPSDGGQDDGFGKSVSLSGNRLLVGSPYDDDRGTSSGSAYIFDFDGNNWNQSYKLISSDGEEGDNFGSSVSLLGNKALIGTPYDDDNGYESGSAYIFEYVSNNWIQSQKLISSDSSANDWFGQSVSLSNEYIIVGSVQQSNLNGIEAGAVYVFEFDGKVWIENNKLTASGGNEYARFGSSVSINGNHILIGAIGSENKSGIRSGSAYIFELVNQEWLQSSKLMASDGAFGDSFGISVSLTSGKALIGAYRDNNPDNSGSVYVFENEQNSWIETQILKANNLDPYDYFGYSVSLSGNAAIIGADQDDDESYDSGSVYMYDLVDNSWLNTQKLTAKGAAYDFFGNSVSISGNRALIGAYSDEESGGSAYIYSYDGARWSLEQKLEVNSIFSDFGYSVSILNDWALIGAPKDTSNGQGRGSAYLYNFDGNHWNQIHQLRASDGESSDQFGDAVSLSENWALVGNPADNYNGSYSGSVYVFSFDTNNWTQEQKLIGLDIVSGDSFGYSVSQDDTRALIGVPNDDDFGSESGSVYIFNYDGSNWIQSQKLTASDGTTNDRFGISVSLSGDNALIGSYQDDDKGFDSGSAYIFEFNGSNWIETQKLNSLDGSAKDYFGYSVSLSENRALIGAYKDDDYAASSGSGYVFNRVDGVWVQTKKITAEDASRIDWLGWSVSLDNDIALVGASQDDDRGTDSGSAYIFNVGDIIFQNGFEEIVPK